MSLPVEPTPDEPAMGERETGMVPTAADSDSVLAAPVDSEKLVFTKICQKCSVQAETEGNFCPNCGASYSGAKKDFKISKKTMIVAISAVVLCGATLAVVLGVTNSNQNIAAEKVATEASAVASRSTQAVASRSAAAAASESAAAKTKADKDAVERIIRQTIITSLEASILKDAQKRETEGRLTGPFTRASCTPLGGGSIDDLTAKTGTFECIAVNKKNDDGSESGNVFSATVNWTAAEYQWHLGR